MSEVVIRKFKINDYDKIMILWKSTRLPCKPDGRDSRDRLNSGTAHGNSLFLVAESDGELVGSILGTHDGRKGWINRLAIAPEFRKRGIARRLVTAIEDWLYQLGIEVISCLVEDENRTSIQTFKKLGYCKSRDIIYLSKKKTPGS